MQSYSCHDGTATYGTATNGDTVVAYTHATWADEVKGTCGAEKANDNVSKDETFPGDHSLEILLLTRNKFIDFKTHLQ